MNGKKLKKITKDPAIPGGDNMTKFVEVLEKEVPEEFTALYREWPHVGKAEKNGFEVWIFCYSSQALRLMIEEKTVEDLEERAKIIFDREILCAENWIEEGKYSFTLPNGDGSSREVTRAGYIYNYLDHIHFAALQGLPQKAWSETDDFRGYFITRKIQKYDSVTIFPGTQDLDFSKLYQVSPLYLCRLLLNMDRKKVSNQLGKAYFKAFNQRLPKIYGEKSGKYVPGLNCLRVYMVPRTRGMNPCLSQEGMIDSLGFDFYLSIM